MKKRIIMFVLCLVLLLALTGCCLSHSWMEANCEIPRICTKCGKTEGEPLGHTWVDATCTSIKTCSACGKGEGSFAEHTWAEATCTQPRTCTVCSAAEGEAADHTYDWTVEAEAGFGKPGTKNGVCSVCGETTAEEIAALVPAYSWGTPVTLELPEAAAQVCVNKAEGEFWIELTCSTLSSRDFVIFMAQSTADWGIDRRAICEQLAAVLEGFQDAWQEGNNACCVMEASGPKWTVTMSMDETANAFIQLKVNALDSFNAATGLALGE